MYFQRCVDCVDITGRSSAKGTKQGWGRENKKLSLSVNISKTVGDSPKLLLMKLRKRFRLTQDWWPWTTLSCNEFDWGGEFRVIWQILEAETA